MLTDWGIGRTIRDPRWERNETERKVAKVLEGVAAKVGASNIQAGASSNSLLPAMNGGRR